MCSPAHLLEVLTGKPLDALASPELFGPLGLQDCGFKLSENLSRSLVPGCSASGQVRQFRFLYEIAVSSLYTTAADYIRFMAATFADQRLLLVTSVSVPVPGAPRRCFIKPCRVLMRPRHEPRPVNTLSTSRSCALWLSGGLERAARNPGQGGSNYSGFAGLPLASGWHILGDIRHAIDIRESTTN